MIYYLGSNMTHGYRMMTKDKLESRNIGAGYLKTGRFVGYHAARVKGELLTRPFLLNGKKSDAKRKCPQRGNKSRSSICQWKTSKGLCQE